MIEAHRGWGSLTIRVTSAVAAVAVVAALGRPGIAWAQDARVYVGGAGMLSVQGAHRQGSGPSLPTTGAGGTVTGGTVESGGFLSPRVALGIEVSVPRLFTSTQETQYLRVFQQESRHRDAAISGVFRGTVGSTSRVRVAVVGGGGFVRESTRQRRRDQEGLLPASPPVFGPYSEEYVFARWTAAGLAGADVEIRIGRHAALVPQMRVHFVRRTGDPSQPGWALGLNSVVVRPAIGVRAVF